ncbi:hypothetical protein KXD40_005935 [Peronospora effusa]|uniref:RxLR effector protein n=1 Tax=Peronospora effusa TaxID=542832 RepID=A0A3M6VLA5_9STRA|nr:hypothetical protein DD238_001501 [Peronospora effusa]RQM16815.1 hypothetical protein DD237_002488 [Peronospora effusa]UIZ27536.1 hypothetical protein KXD40_005935 [Peronospora effusa]
MDMLVLFTVITLLFLRVDAHAHTLDHQEIKSSVLDADISFSSRRTSANVEDLVPDAAGSSSLGHDASLEKAIHGKVLRSNMEVVASTFVSAAVESPLSSVSSPEILSFSPCDEEASSSVATRYRESDAASSSSSRDEAGIIGNIEPTAACSNFGSTFTAAVASDSSSDVATSGQSPATDKPTFQSFTDGSRYSAGTVEPKQEQEVVESTSLEVSALPRQITDSRRKAYISTSTSTHSGDEAILPADQLSSSTNEGNDTSNTNSALFYSFLVLGIAGLVCAVLVYIIKWRVTARNSIMTPTSPATWSPPPSEVHVVMHRRKVVVL